MKIKQWRRPHRGVPVTVKGRRFRMVTGQANCREHRASPALVVLLLTLVAACESQRSPQTLQPIDFDGQALRVEWDPAADGRIAVTLVLATDVGDELLYSGEIANGGQPVTWDNFRPVTDHPPELILCINGSGQPDQSVRIHSKVKTVIAVERACKD